MKIAIVVPHYGSSVGATNFIHTFITESLPEFDLYFVVNQSEESYDATQLPKYERVTVLFEERPGSYAARNKGIDAVQGRYPLICFTDSDCILDQAYFLAVKENYSRLIRNKLTAGGIELIRSGNLFVDAYESIFEFDQRWTTNHGGGVTANLIVDAELFTHIGKFDDSLFSGADNEFTKRFTNGAETQFIQKISVSHPSRGSIFGLVQKSRRTYGGWYRLNAFGVSWVTKLQSIAFCLRPPVRPVMRILKHKRTSGYEKVSAFLVVVLLRGVRFVENLRLILGGAPLR